VKKKPRKTPLLVVDDDRIIRKLLTRVAERAGFEVDSARDGVEALEMLSRKEYEIAIVDLMMPRLSGYELVQRISNLVPRPTVIVATALTNGDVASLDDSMVRRVIRKPFDIEAVAAALIETAQDIAAQRAADAATGKKSPVVVAKDTTKLAKEATILAKDATVVAKDANVLSKDATVLANQASIVAQEAKSLATGTPAEEPPAAPAKPEEKAVPTKGQPPPKEH
jgi:DNA-binding response OmpR family regulator